MGAWIILIACNCRCRKTSEREPLAIFKSLSNHSLPRAVRGVITASGFNARLAIIPERISAARSGFSRMNCLEASRPWPNRTSP